MCGLRRMSGRRGTRSARRELVCASRESAECRSIPTCHAILTCVSLHLVEDVGELSLDAQRFLDLVGAHKGVLAILEEAWALMVADEFDEGGSVGLPVLREAFKVFEDGVQTDVVKQADSVFGVLVEVGVKDALVHEVGLAFDGNENPAEIVEFEDGEIVGRCSDGVFDPLRVLVEDGLSAGDDLCEDAEAVTGGRTRIDGTVAALLELEVALFGDGHCYGMFPDVFCHVVLLEVCDGGAQAELRRVSAATRRVTGPRRRM